MTYTHDVDLSTTCARKLAKLVTYTDKIDDVIEIQASKSHLTLCPQLGMTIERFLRVMK